MGNNFENKHPRAKDGKFTEKLRKESGLTLGLEQELFTPSAMPEGYERGKVLVGKVKKYDPNSLTGALTEYECPNHDEINQGSWWLFRKQRHTGGGGQLTYRTSDGYVSERYGQKWNIERQEFIDRDTEPVQEKENWTWKYWHENGKMACRTRFVFLDSNEALENFKNDIAERGGRLTVNEYFDQQGRQTGGRYYQVAGGELYELKESYSPDGDYRKLESISLNGDHCAPENKPCFVFYQDGEVSRAEYKVERNDESVYHRTDGPAIIDNNKPEGQRERYFLNGIEYGKSEWEKKLGK